jgi:16S rRNA (guanine966-N2)-methyltransferase
MRLSGGTLRNRVVFAPATDAVRPTPGRVKEALFSILADRIAESRVLDLFAGTGAIGFEALSRGASEAVFVERHARQAAAIVRTAESLGVADRSKVLVVDATRAAARLHGRFDLVYADPPYADDPPARIFEALRERGSIDTETIAVYERRSGAKRPPLESPGFTTEREERYGEVTLQFLRAVAP